MAGRVEAVNWLLLFYFYFVLGAMPQELGLFPAVLWEPGDSRYWTWSSSLHSLAPHLLMWCRKVIWIMQKGPMESLVSSQPDDEKPASDSMSRTRPGTWSCWLELGERAAIRKRCPCLVSGKSRYWLSSSDFRMVPIYQHLKFNPWLNSPVSLRMSQYNHFEKSGP